jgi:hypothetical protein
MNAKDLYAIPDSPESVFVTGFGIPGDFIGTIPIHPVWIRIAA